jgi:hypothetical protein
MIVVSWNWYGRRWGGGGMIGCILHWEMKKGEAGEVFNGCFLLVRIIYYKIKDRVMCVCV